jgi:hypothetical protein
MYAVHTTMDTAKTGFFRRHHQDEVNGLSSSNKKAWDRVKITVSQNTFQALDADNSGRITFNMMEAQEAALEKIWGTPEDDVWDDLYKELNA